jgi:hypothetical protein
MLIYATADDFAAWWSKPAPGNAASLLRSASALVGRHTRAALYRVTTEGLPDDPLVAAAFRDATTSQAAFWANNAIDPTSGQLAETSKRLAVSKSIKGATITYDASATAQAQQARVDAVGVLCGEAWLILDNAGLTGGHPTGGW